MSGKKTWAIILDTCCIIAGEGDPHVKQLFEWHDKGIIEIVKTDVMDTEFLKGPRSRVRVSSRYQEDLGVMVIGHSRIGHCVVAGEKDVQQHAAVQNILFPGIEREELEGRQIRDIMHLATHHVHRRDFFVTLDEKHILSKKEWLKRELGIEVLSPDECRKLIKEAKRWFLPLMQ